MWRKIDNPISLLINSMSVFRIFTAYKETNVEYLDDIKYAHTVVQIPADIWKYNYVEKKWS